MTDKAKRLTVTRTLVLGFTMLILIFILFGLYTIYHDQKIFKLTRTIYDHPLTVSNAALQANGSIAKMHLILKDAMLSTSPLDIDHFIKTINDQEKQTYQYLDIVADKIIGDEGKALENEARKLLDNCRLIREEAIELIRTGEKETAASMTTGRGADHVVLLEKKMLKLTNYARNKALNFMNDAEKVCFRLNIISFVFLLLGVIASLLIAILILKQSKSAEMSLIKNKDRLRGIVDSMADWIWEVDSDGRYAYCSEKVERVLGYTPEEMIGKTPFDFMIPEDVKRHKKVFDKIVATKSLIKNFENWNICKDERHICLLTNGVPILNENGDLLGFRGVDRDITKSKLADAALRKSEEKHRKLVSNISDVIVVLDKEGIITYKSPNITEQFGWSPDDLIGKHSLFTVHPDDQERLGEELTRILRQDYATARIEYNYLCKDGSFKPVELTAVNMVNDPIIKGVLANYKDITHRIQANEELRKSEEKFRSTFHTSPDSINLNSIEDGVYLDINDGFTKIMGYTREDVIGKSSSEFDIWSDPKDRERLVEGLKKHGLVENLEANFIRKDGRIRTGLMSARILSIANKDIILSITRDITEKRKAEEALKKSEQKFRELFNTITDLIYTRDMDGHIISTNPAMQKLFGYEEAEFIGRRATDFMEPKFQSTVGNRNMDVIKKQGYVEGIGCYLKKNGEKLYIDYKSFLVKPADGEPYINGVARDVTEKVLSEKELEKLQEQIAQSQKMESIGTLAGGIAHDFNNILFPIVGHTEMLIEDVPEDSPFRDSLDQIYTGALRAKDLVKQILTFSRQDSNELKLMKMQPIIKEALKLIRSTIPTTIEIKQDIQAECGVIKADPTQIHQIIMNLATNAYHAMEKAGGELKVSLKAIELGEYDVIAPEMAPGAYACLSVTDTGKGMNKELIRKIFDPFFTTKEKGKGTGMGLSVVHGIVKSMGGAIQVHSEPDKGAEFKVYFPVEKSSFDKQSIPIHETIQGGIERILLVDDEDAVVIMEKLMLERLGYRVTSRTSSIEALEAFRDDPEKFNLVITDMTMPNMPGDKLAVELTKIRTDIPILLCSGFSETMSEEKAASLGINGFLLKPIVMKDLSQKIREVLDGNGQ